MDEEISKKELLETTGISYGQLYRWKREKLIPDEWFRKRSTHTGQETFLPREAAIRRIGDILRMKDGFTHEELTAFFNPDMHARQYAKNDLKDLITSEALNALEQAVGRDAFAYGELLFALLIEDMTLHGIPPSDLTPCAQEWMPRLGHEGVRILAMDVNGSCFALLTTGECLHGSTVSIVYNQTSAQLIERLKSRIAPIMNI